MGRKEIRQQLEADHEAIKKIYELEKSLNRQEINLSQYYAAIKDVFIFDIPCPTVKGIITGHNKVDWFIKFYCPYCKDWHGHGIPMKEVEMSDTGLPVKFPTLHKVAHCSNLHSPFRTGGYYIKPFTVKELKEFGKDYRLNNAVKER